MSFTVGDGTKDDQITTEHIYGFKRNSLRKMVTTGIFLLRIISVITSLRTCTDLNRSISENDIRVVVPPSGVLELPLSLTVFSFLMLIISPRNQLAPMKLKILITISLYDN